MNTQHSPSKAMHMFNWAIDEKHALEAQIMQLKNMNSKLEKEN